MNTLYHKTLNFKFDFQKIKQEVVNILAVKDRGFVSQSRQIMLQTCKEDVEDWETGTGRNDLFKNDTKETDFIHLNPSVQETELARCITDLGAYRARIMCMYGRSCYSIHADPTPRLHIPIVATDQAWMVWPYAQVTLNMMPGKIYYVNTTKHHNFFNGSINDRIHVIMSIPVIRAEELINL